MDSFFMFCPWCGTPYQDAPATARNCKSCSRSTYRNQSLCTAAIIHTDSQVLLVKRGINPFKGMFDLPGGFVEVHEAPHEGMLRELTEELGWQPQMKPKLFGVYGPDEYPYHEHLYWTTSAVYTISIEKKPQLTASDDAAEICWLSFEQAQQSQIAFPSIHLALQDFLNER